MEIDSFLELQDSRVGAGKQNNLIDDLAEARLFPQPKWKLNNCAMEKGMKGCDNGLEEGLYRA